MSCKSCQESLMSFQKEKKRLKAGEMTGRNSGRWGRKYNVVKHGWPPQGLTPQRSGGKAWVSLYHSSYFSLISAPARIQQPEDISGTAVSLGDPASVPAKPAKPPAQPGTSCLHRVLGQLHRLGGGLWSPHISLDKHQPLPLKKHKLLVPASCLVAQEKLKSFEPPGSGRSSLRQA